MSILSFCSTCFPFYLLAQGWINRPRLALQQVKRLYHVINAANCLAASNVCASTAATHMVRSRVRAMSVETSSVTSVSWTTICASTQVRVRHPSNESTPSLPPSHPKRHPSFPHARVLLLWWNGWWNSHFIILKLSIIGSVFYSYSLARPSLSLRPLSPLCPLLPVPQLCCVLTLWWCGHGWMWTTFKSLTDWQFVGEKRGLEHGPRPPPAAIDCMVLYMPNQATAKLFTLTIYKLFCFCTIF